MRTMRLCTKVFQDYPCTHRAWRYKGHCKFVHGYCRSFKFVFSCDKVDKNGWVMDFSGLKEIKEFLTSWFDHTFLVAKDDPLLEVFMDLDDMKAIQLRIMDNPSIEGTAEFVAKACQQIIDRIVTDRKVKIESVEVIENHKNSAIFIL